MSQIASIPESLLTEIRQILSQARNQVQQSVNTQMVQAYWNIGRLIVEQEQQGKERAEYGKAQLEVLSTRLRQEFGKGFDTSNLRNMRRFYLAFSIWETVSLRLSWSHYNVLARIENDKARQWYLKEAVEQSWSVRALDRQISVLYYERLLSSSNRPVVEQEARDKTQLLASNRDYLRDPYVLDFLDLPSQQLLENDIEQGIISNLQTFLLELGKGFAFVERQQRISTDDQDFYLDLVFYNYKLKCFLLIDLKLGKLNHQDVGQMDTYVRIYDQHRKGDDDNPTIGLILCSEKSEAVARYSVLTDNEQLFASRYLNYLPTEEELRKELERERALLQNTITGQH